MHVMIKKKSTSWLILTLFPCYFLLGIIRKLRHYELLLIHLHGIPAVLHCMIFDKGLNFFSSFHKFEFKVSLLGWQASCQSLVYVRCHLTPSKNPDSGIVSHGSEKGKQEEKTKKQLSILERYLWNLLFSLHRLISLM